MRPTFGDGLSSQNPGNRELRPNRSPQGQDSTISVVKLEWLTLFLFPVVLSFTFAFLIELNRYKVIGASSHYFLNKVDASIFFMSLCAKSMAFLIPSILACGILMLFGMYRASSVIINLACVVIFYLMAFDLFSVSFAGYHMWDYMPHIVDILENPDLKIWQWAGDRLALETIIVLAIFCVFVPTLFFVVKRFNFYLVCSFIRFQHWSAIVSIGLLYVAFAVSAFPCLESIPQRVSSALPFHPSMVEYLQKLTEDLDDQVELVQEVVSIGKGMMPAIVSELHRHDKRLVLLYPNSFNEGKATSDLLDDAQERWSTKLNHFNGLLDLGSKVARTQTFFESNNWLLNTPGFLDSFGHGLSDDSRRTSVSEAGDPTVKQVVLSRDELTATAFLRKAADPGTHDPDAHVSRPGLPNIVMIIFESFRESAVSPELMKELDKWGNQGLRLRRHYSGSNCSHLGLFSLLYGRNPLGYHETLDRKIPAQMLESLRNSGYETTFLTSGETKGFRRLDRFINRRSCDNYVEVGEFSLKGTADWPQSDRKKLELAKNIVESGNAKPQFVFFYLVSSHYPYSFPLEFELLKNPTAVAEFLDPSSQIQKHLNRYSNAVLFLENEVMKTINSMDAGKNLVIVTGDHGESMGEDGVFTHGSRMSEVQMRVPMMMVGPGISPRSISTATTHADVLPTLLHVLADKPVAVNNSDGRDLVADSDPTDEVTLVPANGPDWDGLMIIRADERMIFRPFKKDGKAPVMRFHSLADDSGAFEHRFSRRWRANRDMK